MTNREWKDVDEVQTLLMVDINSIGKSMVNTMNEYFIHTGATTWYITGINIDWDIAIKKESNH